MEINFEYINKHKDEYVSYIEVDNARFDLYAGYWELNNRKIHNFAYKKVRYIFAIMPFLGENGEIYNNYVIPGIIVNEYPINMMFVSSNNIYAKYYLKSIKLHALTEYDEYANGLRMFSEEDEAIEELRKWNESNIYSNETKLKKIDEEIEKENKKIESINERISKLNLEKEKLLKSK